MTLADVLAAVLGMCFGAVVQRTHFCTMGAIADVVLFGSRRRLRSWLLGTATAMMIVHAAALGGYVPSVALPQAGWIGLALGSVAFGFGMVLAGGCLSRNLARVGAGSLKALVVVLVAGIAATAFWQGPLAGLQQTFTAISGSTGVVLAASESLAIAGLILAVALLAFCLKDSSFRGSPLEWQGGLGVGILGGLAFLSVSIPGQSGLNFLIPLAHTVAGAASAPNFVDLTSTLLIVGTVLGASIAAVASGQWRVEAFTTRDDMIRHLVGAVLMGAGGALAAGCAVGHGIMGLALLAPGSVVAVLGMVAGARWALRYLETGQLIGRIRIVPSEDAVRSNAQGNNNSLA
jgi:uncharacterized membrane protein YedE/YeeE